jgi:HD-GYP domain-containing protein (c-di-GMP phosphodiesterase class II)
MATHPAEGVALLDGVEFPWDVRPMIRHHHERWDGMGYPDRLFQQDIPVAARILTVADVYDALTSTRSYRTAFAPSKAWEVMLSEAGKTFDPELVPLFRKVIESGVEPVPAFRPVGVLESIPISRAHAIQGAAV